MLSVTSPGVIVLDTSFSRIILISAVLPPLSQEAKEKMIRAAISMAMICLVLSVIADLRLGL